MNFLADTFLDLSGLMFKFRDDGTNRFRFKFVFALGKPTLHHFIELSCVRRGDIG